MLFTISQHHIIVITKPNRQNNGGSAVELAKIVIAVAEEFQIVDRIWGIILDNCSTNTSMITELSDSKSLGVRFGGCEYITIKITSHFHSALSHVRDMNHILNLITQAAFVPFKTPPAEEDHFATSDGEEAPQPKKKGGKRKASSSPKTKKNAKKKAKTASPDLPEPPDFNAPQDSDDEEDHTPWESSFWLNEGLQDNPEDIALVSDVVAQSLQSMKPKDQLLMANVGEVLKKVSVSEGIVLKLSALRLRKASPVQPKTPKIIQGNL